MGSERYQYRPLEDLCSIHDSVRVPIKKSERKPGPYPYYGASGVTDFVEGFLFDGDYVLLAEDGDNLKSRNTPIAFMARGKFWVNNHAHVLSGKGGNDTDYVCYALQVADVTSYISGSTRPKITQRDMRRIPVPYATIPEQKSIAHILGTLDDKIELNGRMNGTLESMAGALFKSWFVDFDPVIDKALAAGNPIPEPLQARAEARRALGNPTKPLPKNIQKLFPDDFHFNEEMGWIPVGWEVGPILNHATLLSGGTPKTSIDAYWNGTIKWASAKDVSQCGNAFLIETDRNITQEGLDNSSTKVIPRLSTVIVSRGATTGRLTMFGEDIAMNQTCYALRSNGTDHFFLYCHSQNFIDSLVNSAHGSVFDTITTKTFQSTSVLLPPKETSQQFDDLVKKTFESVLRNLHENLSLTKLRDTLLPQLLSGELRIPDAEKLVAGSL